MTKRCYVCHRDLPVSAFTKNRTKPGGLKRECRDCVREAYFKAKEVPAVPCPTKRCSLCRATKKASEFSKQTASKDGLKLWCKVCCKADEIKRLYGIEYSTYLTMAQRGCEVCQTTERLHVDHDHSCCPGTRSCGKCIRGMLCQRHNHGIANFQDSQTELLAAIDYLERHEGRVCA